jgi:hypothetical protein
MGRMGQIQSIPLVDEQFCSSIVTNALGERSLCRLRHAAKRSLHRVVDFKSNLSHNKTIEKSGPGSPFPSRARTGDVDQPTAGDPRNTLRIMPTQIADLARIIEPDPA